MTALHGRATRLGAVVAFTVVSALLIALADGSRGLASAPAAPTTSTTSPARTAPATDTPKLTLRSQTVWVAPNGTVTGSVHVEDAPTGAKLQPVLWGPVRTRSAFNSSKDGKAFPGSGTVLPAKAVASTSGVVNFQFRLNDGTTPPTPTDPDRPDADIPTVTVTSGGVYPLVYELLTPDRATAARLITYVVRLNKASPDANGRVPLRVMTVLDGTTAPATDHDGNLELSEQSRTHLENLSAIPLDPDKDPPVAIRVSPDAIDALANSTRAADAELLEGLQALRPVATYWPAPYVSFSTAAWLADPELAPIADELATRGKSILRDHLRAEGTIADLNQFAGNADVLVAPTVVPWLAQNGITTMLVEPTSVQPLDANAYPRTLARPFRLALPNGNSVLAAEYDAGLSAHFDEADPQLAANHIMGDLAVIALDLPSIERGVVLATPRGEAVNPTTMEAVLSAISDAKVSGTEPLITPTSAGTFFSTVPAARQGGDATENGPALIRTLVTATTPALNDAFRSSYLRTRAKIAAYGAMLPGGKSTAKKTIDSYNRRISVATSADLSSEEALHRLDGVSHEIDDGLASVQIPQPQTITLTSRTSTVPLTIRRAAKGPTVVRLSLDTEARMRFSGGNDQLITLKDTVTRVELKVHVDAPGDSLVKVRVTSPDGSLLVGHSELRVRSTAVSGIGIIITAGSLVFLLVWWVRDIVRNRRQKAANRVRPADLIDINPPDPD